MTKLIALTSVVALVIAGPLVASAAVIGPISFSSGTINQGQTFSFSGSCGAVAANGTVTYTLSSGSSTQSGSVMANGSGNFSTNITLPANFPTGTGALIATCPNGDTVTGSITINAPIGSTLSLSGTPTLGQGLTVSGSCGSSVSGSPVSFALVRASGSVNLGTTTTTNADGSFSGSFTVPSNAGGGPVTIVATCPTGTVTLNTSIIDPLASVALGDGTPNVGAAFNVVGVCGTTAGGNVTFTLSNSSDQVSLGNTTTSANGSFSTVLTVPNGFATGPALITAVCPTGNVIMSAVIVDPAAVGGTVDLTAPTGGTAAGTPAAGLDVGGTGEVSSTPVGGVAAGRGTDTSMALGLALMIVGVAGFIGSKRIADSLNDNKQ